ncbi:MAG TPA: DEAD/DEAH box helicase [Phycisphaerae bacterium]|nr:DEAD/DEAH box helicase [Phycisphaerae bacterium]HRW53189.1 DEAD/DEAH box helicase [Phycisphaerae bacterium]
MKTRELGRRIQMEKQLKLPQAFAELGIETPILQALAAMGYEEPSPIQRELIPHVLAGRDVLGQARTGTGKTASFGIPICQQVDPNGRLQAMILTPTRELAAQVLGELRRISKVLELHCVPVYGGTNMRGQIRELGRKPHIIVGTPGRVMDMMSRGALELDGLRFAVLDEVDRMLDIGFRDDIRKILGGIRGDHQTVFVSATLEGEVKRLAMRYMHEPVEVNVSQDQITVSEITQQYTVIEPQKKFRLLTFLLKREQPKLMIIFTRTKHGAKKLAKQLHAAGFVAKEIHGDLVQQKRERVMERFRKHHIPILVATDLAARGIDVSGITHIVNYDMPEDPEVYVHRIGRTARMGAKGMAISFVAPDQGEVLTKVEMLINEEIGRLDMEGFNPGESRPAAPRDGDGRAKSGGATKSDAPKSSNEPAATASDSAPKPRPLFVKLPPRHRR